MQSEKLKRVKLKDFLEKMRFWIYCVLLCSGISFPTDCGQDSDLWLIGYFFLKNPHLSKLKFYYLFYFTLIYLDVLTLSGTN